jgi:hypothetical protein
MGNEAKSILWKNLSLTVSQGSLGILLKTAILNA